MAQKEIIFVGMVCRRKLWGIKCSLTWKAHRMLINPDGDSFKDCADSLGIVRPILNRGPF